MRYKTALSVLFILAHLALPASAKSAQTLGTFGNWKTYKVEEDRQPVCYMVLTAHTAKTIATKVKSKGKWITRNWSRGDAHLTITHRPAEGSVDVVSYDAGYNFKTASDVKARIDAANFDMFTQKDTAWTRDARTDHALTAAIRKSSALTMTGQSAHPGSPNLTDKIDLAGADAAYHVISKACGIEKATPKPKSAPTAKKKK